MYMMFRTEDIGRESCQCNRETLYRQQYNNKSAQSNLGRGPRRGAVAHVRRKFPLVTMARPKFDPKSTPSRRPIPKPQYLPHPWTRPTYDAKQHPDPIRRFSTMHWSD